MTISTTQNQVIHTGDGVSLAFAYPFPFIASTDLKVYLAGVLQASGYSVAGISPLGGSGTFASGTVTFLVPPPIGQAVLIYCDPDLLQSTSLPPNDSLPAKTLEKMADKLTLLIQRIYSKFGNAITFPVGETTNGVLPPANVRANQLAGFDSAGNVTAIAAAAQSATALTLSLASTAAPGVDGPSMVGFKGPEANEVAKTVYLNLIEVKRVSRWGVDPANSAAANRAALQNAINSGTKRELVFNEGAYQLNDLCTVPNGSIVYLTGQGSGVTRLVQTDLTKGLIKFDLNFAQGGGVRGLTLTSNVAVGANGSTGVALQVVKANDQFMCRDFEVVSFDKCLRVDSSFQPSFKDFRLLYFGSYGVYFSPYTGAGTDTAGTRWSNGKISNFGYTGVSPENSLGIWMEQGSGEFFDTIDIQQVGLPVLVAPPASSFARFLKFKTVLADTAYFEGWTLDGTNAPLLNVRMLDCYAAGAGGGANRPVGSTRGAGLLTKGANLDDLIWIGGELRDNDVGGWDHQGGTNCRLIDASVSRNSRRVGFDNTYPGVRVRAGVSEWAVKGCRIGNFSLGVFNVSQAEGIVVDVGASANFQITDNDLRNPGAGKQQVSNGSTNSNWIIRDNLPVSTAGVNQDRGSSYSGSSVGTVPANTTRYLTQGGQQASENDAFVVAGQPGVARQFIAQVDTAPGAGQSFAYTVRLNGANTGMGGSISGAGAFQIVLTQAFNIAAGDTISIQLLTSTTAAAARHRFVLNVDS